MVGLHAPGLNLKHLGPWATLRNNMFHYTYIFTGTAIGPALCRR